MKGILFKPDMIKAIVEGRKTVTRRVLRLQPLDIITDKTHRNKNVTRELDGHICWCAKLSDNPPRGKMIYCRYQVGEVVYIKEAWQVEVQFDDLPPCMLSPDMEIWFKDEIGISDGARWRSPIHLRSDFARYFIKIKDVRPDRLQEITEEDAVREGFNNLAEFITKFEEINFRLPQYERNEKGNLVITHYNTYKWAEGYKVEEYRGKPHYIIGNPWVWRIEFEMTERG